MFLEEELVAMDGDEPAGAQELVQEGEVLAKAVAGDVHTVEGFVVDPCAALRELVDGIDDGGFIARDVTCGPDDVVIVVDLEVGVLVA